LAERFEKFPTVNQRVISTLDVSPDGKTLVIGQQGELSQQRALALALWSAGEKRILRPLVRSDGAIIQTARFSPSGKWLAYQSAQQEQEMVICDLDARVNYKDTFPLKFVKWMCFAWNCDRLLAGGIQTQVWDAESWEVIWTLKTEPMPLSRGIRPAPCALCPDGQTVAASGVDAKSIVFYNVADGGEVNRLAGISDRVHAMAFDPKGRFLAALFSQAGAAVWDLENGVRILSDVLDTSVVYRSVRFHPDGQHVALGLWSGFVEVINFRDGRYLLKERGHHGSVGDLAFFSDGKRMVTGGDDGAVLVWNLE